MRVHLLGLPHTETTAEYSWCAYTQKVRKLSSMLTDNGHQVFLYGGEANEARCTEAVAVVDREWQAKHFSHFNWARDVFNEFHPESDHWIDFNARCAAAIRERMEPGDILGLSMGWSQKPAGDALPELLPVEVGIGYSGVWAPYRVYESYAWAHHLAGLRNEDAVRFYDAVIPNSFEVEEFPMGTPSTLFSKPYLLFIGRFIKAKGVEIAVETAKRAGLPLVLAGQGAVEISPGRWRGIDVEVEVEEGTHLGVLGPEERAKVMGGALAVMVPTTYLEPFGGVAVEAMMCGTPVITTDWGAFTETVAQGVSGFRCRTLSEFTRAVDKARDMDRHAIREYAISRYSTNVIGKEYDRYLERLGTLWGDGWYT